MGQALGRRARSLLYRGLSKPLKLRDPSPRREMTSLDAGKAWLELISSVNRRQLASPPARRLRVQAGEPVAARLDARLRRGLLGSTSRYEYIWTIALNALGAEWAHRVEGRPEDLAALKAMFDGQLDAEGIWLTPIERVDHAMKGYSLLYLAEVTGCERYQRAADCLAESLVRSHPRAGDGSLPYDLGSGALLVDSLAMVCPFLARYSAVHDDAEALELAANQLGRFVQSNVDGDTHLPYHGYYADGPKRLGLHGWGRGTGWYMLGLVDTLGEMPADHPAVLELNAAYVAAAKSVRERQRSDGHWSWAVLHRNDRSDSSATSLIGYAVARGVKAGILDSSYRPAIDAAVGALCGVTRVDGVLEGSSAECRGLGKYPQVYGPQPWLQGAATALAALHLGGFGREER